MKKLPPAELNTTLGALDGRLPDTAEYQHLCELVIDHPAVARLNTLDPFSEVYRACAMQLYLELRGGSASDYDPFRDEVTTDAAPRNIWSEVTPWSFRDATFLSEFLFSWGHILQLLGLPNTARSSVIEYGPGSGQLLLLLARIGVEAYGVDIDAGVLANIQRQAEAMDLPIETEQAEFGAGFGDTKFDRIVFYEAFHHAFEFEALLWRLHDRLKPGGRLVLCGEPVVPYAADGVPYPWGPRLDGLSIFCIRRFGWMELGFTHKFLMETFRRCGWTATFHPFAACARANAYVAVPAGSEPVKAAPVQMGPRVRAVVPFIPAPLRGPLRRMRNLIRRR